MTLVAKYGFGKFLHALYKVVTGWTDDTSENYLEAPCYKIVTFDPKDEVIPLMASLRYNVTKRVIEKLLGVTSDELKPTSRIQNLFVILTTITKLNYIRIYARVIIAN